MSDPRLAAYQDAADAIRTHLLFDEPASLLDHWLSIWDDPLDILPERTNLDPISIIHALPHVFVIEKENDSGRLHYRLAGEGINNRYETGIIGKFLDEITEPDIRDRVHAYFNACIDYPAIVLLSGILFAERDKPSYGERLLLPIQDNSMGCFGILGITMQSHVFPDAETAYEASKRILRIAPLSTGILDETEAPS